MRLFEDLRRIVKEEAKEIELHWHSVQSVGKEGNKYFYRLKNGGKMVYDDIEKLRYALRNSGNVPGKIVDDKLKLLG